MVSAGDPEAPPLTFPEQCQILVLGDCSRKLAGGRTPPAPPPPPGFKAESSAQGESKGVGCT